MTRIKRFKLNHVLFSFPQGRVLTSSWLQDHGISAKLAWWYVRSNWLERVGEGAYKKWGDKVSWVGALHSLQTQIKLPMHIGGKTALTLLGKAHFIPMQGFKTLFLFNRSSSKAPRWFTQKHKWQVELIIKSSNLFRTNTPSISIINKNIEGIDLELSSPERAALELTSLIPELQSFDEASKLIELLVHLRPTILQRLLEDCKSIKAKRLFLYFADKFQHPWFSKIDITKIDLGKGKRVIGGGGCYIPKYQISVPKIKEC